jgi:hypothetical protein
MSTRPTRPAPATDTAPERTPPLPVIDLIPALDRNGVEVWASPDDQPRTVVVPPSAHGTGSSRPAGDGPVPLTDAPVVDRGRITAAAGRAEHQDHPATSLPTERFAAQTPEQMAAMIQAIRDAEQGRANTPEVTTAPDGKIRFGESGRHVEATTSLPRETFAAPPVDDIRAIRAIDPDNLCSWYWHDESRGWVMELHPDVFSQAEYVFLIRREPSRRNEWFAYCLAPNVDHLVGHRHHLQSLNGATVVCLRPGFRGHPSIRDVHAALAKWCIYIEFIRRDLPAPFSA